VFLKYEGKYKGKKLASVFPVVPLYLDNKKEPLFTLLVFINPEEGTVIDVVHLPSCSCLGDIGKVPFYLKTSNSKTAPENWKRL